MIRFHVKIKCQITKLILVNQKFKPGSTQILLFRSCVKMVKVYLVVIRVLR